MSEYIYQSNGEPLANERGKIYLARANEIVRCKDCEHRYDNQCGRYPDWFDIELDGFCAWGERKEQ